MPSHMWGDTWFEKNGNDLDVAINYIMSTWTTYGRIGTHGKEKYGCYDEQTKVLTKEGWKFFKDIKIDDEFTTLHGDNKIQYNKATYFINKKL